MINIGMFYKNVRIGLDNVSIFRRLLLFFFNQQNKH